MTPQLFAPLFAALLVVAIISYGIRKMKEK